jgi:hypothetical protein
MVEGIVDGDGVLMRVIIVIMLIIGSNEEAATRSAAPLVV